MGRAPCCEKEGLKKGPWTPEEDKILVDYIQANGHGSWRSLPKLAGLLRCGKSCRLRWTNYLRPDIKRGPFTPEEQKTIIQLHGIVGNKWSTIAAQIPGRTDNEVKNYWNTHLKKKLLKPELDTCSPAIVAGAAPISPATSTSGSSCSATRHMAQWESAKLIAEARLAKESLLGSSAAVELTPPASVAGEKPELAPEPDFFLRIWNSDVGRAFRSESEKRAGGLPAAGKVEVGSGIDVAGGEWWRDADVAEDMYLDFDAGIGSVSLFDQFDGQFGNFTLLDGDLGLRWEFEKSTRI